jgi:hypothetical protein
MSAILDSIFRKYAMPATRTATTTTADTSSIRLGASPVPVSDQRKPSTELGYAPGETSIQNWKKADRCTESVAA